MILAVESAMRLREMFTLHLAQLDLPRRTVFLDKTKNGDKRRVPLSSVALAELRSYLDDVHGPSPEPGTRLFPWWNGEANDLDATSDYLSKLFIDIFSPGRCPGAEIP